MRALLILAGSYPYYLGGVSSWAKSIIDGMKNMRFDILSIVEEDGLKPRYTSQGNVDNIFTVIPSLENDYSIVGSSTDLASPVKTLIRYFLGGSDPLSAGKALGEIHENLMNGASIKGAWKHLVEEIKDLKEIIDLNRLKDLIRIALSYLELLKIKLDRYDLIHSSLAGFSGLPGIACKALYGTPYLLTEHGIYFRERMLDIIQYGLKRELRATWSMIIRKVVELNYYWADKIIAVSSFNREWELRLGASPRKIEVIHNGVDLRKFKPLRSSERWSIVSISRIHYLKDILNLIEAMSYLAEKDPRIKCYIYGPIIDEGYARYCKLKIRELGLDRRVKLMGEIMDPRKAYQRAWIYVSSSLSEGSPISILEAMACGKPIIATDAGGTAEILGDSGIVVPPRNPEALADAIGRLMRDKRLAIDLGKAARRRVEELFSLERMIGSYRRIYDELGRG